MSRCASSRRASSSASVTSRTASQGESLTAQSASAAHMFPIPATNSWRWSASASGIHPEVAAQRESAFETQEEVLADRVDPFQSPAVEPFGDT